MRVVGKQKRDRLVMVQALILNQLSNQFRVVTLAAERGYPLQAMAGLSVVYELAAAIGYINGRSDRASEWLTHSRTEQSYPSSRQRPTAIRCLLEAGGVNPSQLAARTDEWEKHYEFCCMAKHGNPTILRRYGARMDGQTLRLFQGPIGGAGYDEMSQLAIFRGAQLLTMATSVFLQGELHTVAEPSARRLTRRLDHVVHQLVEAADSLPRRKSAT